MAYHHTDKCLPAQNRQQSGTTSNLTVLEKLIFKESSQHKMEIYCQNKTLNLVCFLLLIFVLASVCLFSWRIVPNDLVATPGQSGVKVEIMIKIAA